MPTRANGQPAFGIYPRTPAGVRHAIGLLVLTLGADRLRGYTRFEPTVLAAFGLPLSRPA